MKTLIYQRLRRKPSTGEEQPCPDTDRALSPLSSIGDDILLEILLRLSDFKCIVECASVCKRWLSAIIIIRRLNHHHCQKTLNDSSSLPSTASLPFTLLFRGSYRSVAGLPLYHRMRRDCSLSFEFFSEGSKILEYGQSSALEILGWKGDNNYAYLWSFFNDLLLVEQSPERLYLCNPFTRQCVGLPLSPNSFHQLYRYALVVLGYDENLMIEYKVVKISTKVNNFIGVVPLLLHLAIFCSKTGQWSHSSFKLGVPLNIWHHQSASVGSNGIVYWPYGCKEFQGIVALDSCSELCRLIDLPFDWDWRYCVDSMARVGVVHGRLRLVQLFWHEKNESYVFKAWERVDEDDYELAILAFHPCDGDVFFFSRSNGDVGDEVEVSQCRILGQNQCQIETLCHLPPKSPANSHVVSLLHPSWPTQIPHYS
ncbi:uncharacterized protein LOC133781377 isoform X2 [Humulus lupulus]|uniref:uncharacterized protein LOC133781377 isoform X2 n=1 Tax=Humulus lupulus TaxID=3486 RepID=UPI002B40D76E|nr:uncharacterized protein LOC133781377 isoform X2 [Humulus lupulus]